MRSADRSRLTANPAAMASRLKLLSHPERLLMLCRLDEGEASVGELVSLAGLSQPSVSQHLALLRDDGVVSIRSEAQTRYYKLKDPVVSAIIHALCTICGEGPAQDGRS